MSEYWSRADVTVRLVSFSVFWLMLWIGDGERGKEKGERKKERGEGSSVLEQGVREQRWR